MLLRMWLQKKQYSRFDRINLARLVVAPAARGQGVGKQLVGLLLEAGRTRFRENEFSLFVYKHNKAAYRCYLAMGFTIAPYPDGAPLEAYCHYLTRPVDRSATPDTD